MMSYSNVETVYEKYCSMLYSIALQICDTKKKARELLTTTFKKIHQEDISKEKYPYYCITLMRLIIRTARELYPKKFSEGFALTQFEKTPLLNRLICEEKTLQDYCKENNLTGDEALQIIRIEFSRIRNVGKENRVIAGYHTEALLF